MKNARTKIIVGLVAFLTAGSLFAIKGKMMHHRGMHHKKANVENCHGMQHDADVNKKSKNLRRSRPRIKKLHQFDEAFLFSVLTGDILGSHG